MTEQTEQTEQAGSPAMPGAPRSERFFRGDIQGMRALAVMSVLLYHAGVPLLPGGLVGVDVFFVISGFLIGGHLLAELRSTGGIRLGEFYARRARRILPAAIVTIVGTVVAAFLFLPPLRLPEIVGDATASAASVPNLRFAVLETDYLQGTAPSPFQQFWSLGVEEQFYLVIPLLLIVVATSVRCVRALPAVIGALSAASLVAFLWDPASVWTFFAPWTRAWELGAGVLAAVAVRHVERVPAAVARIAGCAGLALVLGSFAVVGGALPHPGAATLIPVAGAVLLVLSGGHSAGGPVSRLLGLRPLLALGAWSYALYLVHWPILAITAEALQTAGVFLPGENLPPLLTLALAAASIPVAYALHRLVERPALTHLRTRQWGSRRTIATALATVVALSVPLVVAGPAVAQLLSTSDRPAPHVQLGSAPSGTTYVPSNVTPALAAARDDAGELYSNGCQQNKTSADLITCEFGPPEAATTVALFGDSHAGRWFPALRAATEGSDVRIVSVTKSGCRSIEAAELWDSPENPSCASWRADAVEWLHEHSPEVIVLADHLGPATDDERDEQHWRGATRASIQRLPESSRVLVLAETPGQASSPPICLSAHTDDALACATDRDVAVAAGIIAGEEAGARDAGAAFADPTELLCDAELCPAIIGDTLMYADEHHLTATGSALLGPWLRGELARVLEPAE
ncbi:peptidoglycan/LPS O-acetylase OafA/YrhL [Microbacterium terrae]|uniref:acyltransferase family protein n=1 Tax=Microbacterium terrae TaxID=69369 RepID=UPI0014702C3B|nr:acyltransferase family protein [Microbacterium terrae]MBP1076161.1 peptidoglycan/LPS O-acetylase OafA/YrhL [Microbacterium terrae]